MRVSAAVLAVLLCSCTLPGGPTSKACTLIGCEDQFSATVTRADDSFPAGAHKIEMTSDGTTLSCTFTFPLATPPGGGTAGIDCPLGLRVYVGAATTCTSTETDAAKVLSCQPIAGHFVETISVSGKPVQVHLQQSVDGAPVLDQTATPSYQASQPNGPGCDPICHQASASWTLPPS